MTSSRSARRAQGKLRHGRPAAAAVALALILSVLAVLPAQAAGPSLTITPTTWNIVGLDSNKPAVANGNPNEFPVGAKVCNAGDAAATNVQTTFAWTTTNSNLALTNPSLATRSLGSIAAGSCAQVTYNVEVNRNQQSFSNRTRGYQITATATGGLSVSTPASRELYVEKLVSQSRNAVVSISSAACTAGSCLVYKGQTYKFTLNSRTATQGYEQLESFVNFPDSIFEIQDVKVTYAAPAGATNNKVYADACGWNTVTTSPSYRSCIGPTNYSGGKAGGNPIKTVYTVKIVGTGTGTLSGLVYDFSGSSFHYNADFGTGANAVPFTASDAADLSLTKTHTGAFVRGGTGTYTLTVSNAGPATSGAITVTDTLPAGLTYKSFSGTGWSCSACSASSQTVTLTRAGLASGAASSVNLTVDVGASASAASTNRATVTQATTSTLNDPVSGNNAANDPTTVAAPGDADLVLTKTRDTVFDPGENETYTLGVRNDGPDPAVGPLTLTDTLPTGMTFVSATGTGWSCSANGQVVTCERASGLASLESAPNITMVVAVAADAPARMTNTTSVVGSINNDPNPSNNVNVTDVALAGAADLWIEKTHTGSFPRGGSASYTITVGNRGPDVAATPRVVDTLPSGLTFVSASGSGWACSSTGQTVTCDSGGNLGAGASKTLTINVNVASGAAAVVTNKATVCSVMTPGSVTGCLDQEQGTSEVDSSDNSTEDATATVAPTDLALTKTASVSSVNTNTSYTYTLKVTNNGPNAATGVTIVDRMPSYVDPASITTSPGPSNTSTPPYCDVSDLEITCDLGTVSATAGSNTATATITVKALASASGRTIVNQASVFSDLGDTNHSNDEASAPVTINGTLNNAAPTAANKSATVAHSNQSGVDVVLSGSDADGDPLTFNLVSADGGAAHGSVTVSGNIATYVPDGDFAGTDTFQYRANDGVTSSAPATVTITVTNSAPTTSVQTVSLLEDTSETITLDGTDPDGDVLTHTITTLPANGTLYPGADATGQPIDSVPFELSGDEVTYVPDEDFRGPDPFFFTVTDGVATSSTTKVDVWVLPVNDAPVAQDATITIPAGAEEGDISLGPLVSDLETPDQWLTYEIVTAPTDGEVTLDGDVATYTHTGTLRDGDSFTYKVIDRGDYDGCALTDPDDCPAAESNVATITIEFDDTNADLSIQKSHVGSFERGGSGVYSITVGNAGPDAAATPRVVDTLPAGLTYTSATGDGWTCTAAAQVVTCDRGAALAAGETAPTLTLNVDVAQSAGSTVTNTAEVCSLTSPIVTVGCPEGAQGTGDDDPSDDSVNDPTATVDAPNQAPTASDETATVPHRSATGVAIELGGSDPEGDDLSFHLASANGGAAHGTVTISGTTATYVPTGDYVGTDTFEYRANDGTDNSPPATVTVTLTNSAPTLASASLSPASVTTTGAVTASAITPADGDGDTLSYTYVWRRLRGGGSHLLATNTTGSATDTIDLASASAPIKVGDDIEVTITVNDGHEDSPERTDVVRVGNSAPTTSVQTVSLLEDTSETITLDGTDPDGDVLTHTITTLPANGTLYPGADATGQPIDSVPFELPGDEVTYVPDPDFRGPDPFFFTVTDGVATSSTTKVDVWVLPVNDAPVAQDAAITIPAGAEEGDISLGPLVSDLETPDQWLTYEIVTAPTDGEVTLDGDVATYTHTGTLRDGDSFTYKVIDRGDYDGCALTDPDDCPAAESNVATITIEFANGVPSADAQSVATDEDTAKTITLTGSDLEDDPLSFEITALPNHGSLYAGNDASGSPIDSVPEGLAGAHVTYVPDPDYNGPDEFAFKSADAGGDSAAATVSVTVRPVNDAPVAQDGTLTVPASDDGAQLDLAPLVHDHETADGALAYTIVGDPADGTARLDGSTLTYSRTASGWDDDELTFKVTDGGDPDDCGVPVLAACAAPRDSNVATITIKFAYVPPTATAQQVTTPEDTDLPIDLDGTASGGRSLSYRVVSLPQHGSLLDGSGSPIGTTPFVLVGDDLVYAPDADYDGDDAFSFAVDDGKTVSDPATVEIDVTPVNDPPVAHDDVVTAPNDAITTIELEGADPDGDGLTFAIATPPAHGTLGEISEPECSVGTCAATVDYTPDAGYAGADELTFTVDDGTATSEEATIAITVMDAGPDETPSPETSPTPDGTATPDATPTPDASATPVSSPAPEATPTPVASPTPTRTPSTGDPDAGEPGGEGEGSGVPSPATPPLPPVPTPTPDYTPGYECGDPIEVTAIGETIVGTPCSELIIVHAEVLATIEALGGDDTVRIDGTARVQINAGPGNDEVDCTTTPAEVIAGPGNDVVRCGASADLLRGGRGRDVLNGGYGDDEIFGGKGSDRLEGSEGDDVMIASLGVDGLFGGPGLDVLKGQAGDDELRGGTAADLLRGSGGNDTELGGEGDDVVRAGPGNDLLEGGAGNDRLVGNEGVDHVRGNNGDDVLRGQNGPDVLHGLKGSDVLKGAGGHNQLFGGWGHDTCVAPSTGNSWSGCETKLRHLV